MLQMKKMNMMVQFGFSGVMLLKPKNHCKIMVLQYFAKKKEIIFCVLDILKCPDLKC